MAKGKKTEQTKLTEQAKQTTDLAVIAESDFLALRPDSDIREALEANLAPGESIQITDLIRVPIPTGGATTWVVQDITGPANTDAIEGVLVYHGMRGTLWPSEEPSNLPPVMVSYDLEIGYRVGEELGDVQESELEKVKIGDDRYDWQKLSYNQWRTSKSGRGKRCKESRLLCILRKEDAFPLLVHATPGSLKTVVPFIKRLPVTHFRAVVSLSLHSAVNKGGQSYAQIAPKLVKVLSREEGVVVRQLYTEPLGKVMQQFELSASDYAGEE